jgi:hypothetical protein
MPQREVTMAKTTIATLHQEVDLQNKGIEVEFWEDEVKGGRLVIRKASIEWYEAHAKNPTWTGTWEDLARVLSNQEVACDHCGVANTVRKGAGWHTCSHCGQRIIITG